MSLNPLAWFTSTPKVVDNVFDKDSGLLTQVGQFIGHQQYTDQEKQEDQKVLVKSVQDYAVATLGENTERSKTRRELALMWFGMHVFFIKVTFLAALIDHLIIKLERQEGYELFNALSGITFDPWLCGITGGVGLFFWGSHALRSSKLSK
tara:strand:- start:1 stop:450 length:450 start_codon:yes stop_codon:yes gene_type:complete